MTKSEFRELDVHAQMNFVYDNEIYEVYEDIMSECEYDEWVEYLIEEGGRSWRNLRDLLNQLDSSSDTGYWYRDPYGDPTPIDSEWEVQEYIVEPTIEAYDDWDEEDEEDLDPVENLSEEECEIYIGEIKTLFFLGGK